MYTVCVLGDLDIMEDSLVGHNIKTLPVVVAVPLKKIIIFPSSQKSRITFVLMFLAHVRHQSVCLSKHFGLGGFNFVTTFAFFH